MTKPFNVPRTQKEISDAALDGDPLTGLEVQTARDGSAIDEVALRANLDGDPMTRDPREEQEAKLRPKLPTPWDRPSPKPPGA